MDIKSLTFTGAASGDQRASLLSVVASLDEKWKLINDTIDRLTIAIPQQQATAIATGFSRLHVQTVLPSRTRTFRIVSRDASGRIGTADGTHSRGVAAYQL